jgi:hypothetical protein
MWGFLSYATILDGLAWLADYNVNKQHCCARNNGRTLLWIWRGDIKGTWNELVSWVRERVEVGRDSERYGGRWRHPIVGAGKWRVDDVYAEVPLWSASGPIALDCPDVCLEAFWLQEWEWVLEDCHKRSCWKNSIGVSVLRPCGSDVYVCSKSFRLCLTVVYDFLECNKVPSWIEPRVRYNMNWWVSVFLSERTSSLVRDFGRFATLDWSFTWPIREVCRWQWPAKDFWNSAEGL